jgi:hypothetical protein
MDEGPGAESQAQCCEVTLVNDRNAEVFPKHIVVMFCGG